MDQILYSDYKLLGAITLPPSQGRQLRYHTFDLSRPEMPIGYADYLGAVTALVVAAAGIEPWKPGEVAHLTIDEKVIKAGASQRRPKPHVDGCFRVTPQGAHWGGGGSGGWLHYCNNVGATQIGRMPVIVAASVSGCRAWKGIFKGRPAPDGDLSHISDQLGEGEVLPANVGYLLSPDCVHESMTFDQDTLRTFIRIALPAPGEISPRD